MSRSKLTSWVWHQEKKGFGLSTGWEGKRFQFFALAHLHHLHQRAMCLIVLSWLCSIAIYLVVAVHIVVSARRITDVSPEMDAKVDATFRSLLQYGMVSHPLSGFGVLTQSFTLFCVCVCSQCSSTSVGELLVSPRTTSRCFFVSSNWFHGISRTVLWPLCITAIDKKVMRLVLPLGFGLILIVIPTSYIGRSYRPCAAADIDNIFEYFVDYFENQFTCGGFEWYFKPPSPK